MKTTLRKPLLLLIFLVFATTFLSAQAPVFISVTPNTNSPAKYDKFELDISLSAGFTNPYDYEDIAVQCTFSAPGGRMDVVDGFYMQDYTLDVNNNLVPAGTGSFKVRYAPNETGLWSYVVSCKNLVNTTTQAVQTFQCIASQAPGFIRKNATNYLSFDNGGQYIPIGENMGWQSNNVVNDYTNWLTDLASNNGNFIRVWMSSWAFALEWKNVYSGDGYAGLKKYNQSHAFYLDWLLDYCKQKDMFIMLALNNHGQVSTNVDPQWDSNPYNSANGGPAANTWEFFTNATARALHKNRLRYIVARYGYSQNIQSWELFNELHWTNNFENHKSEITTWDNEMSTYLKSLDVYKHLVTTSYGGSEITTGTWNLPNIDFSQTHFYVNSPNIESILSSANQSFLMQYSKPTLNGEFGLGPGGNVLSVDDPNGIHIHNAIWGSMFSGSFGSAMTWWWDNYIEPQNLYYHYKPLSALVSRINFTGDNYKRVAATTSGGGASDIIISPGGNYEKAAAAEFTLDAAGNLTPGALSLSQYVFGSVYNTALRNPPTFNVNYPLAGKFKVVVAEVSASEPKITIYLDNVQLLNENAISDNTYSIDVPAGQHAIKVDNLGIDWTKVSNYIFTNIGSPLTTYVLKSAAGNKAAGYILNNQYNWQYLKNNGNVAPPVVQGSSVVISGMQNGNYMTNFYSTSSGNAVGSAVVTVNNSQLTLPAPDIAWDLAFTVVENSVLPVQLTYFTGQRVNKTNRLQFNIGEAKSVKQVFVERSSNGNNFTTLKLVSPGWITISGTHNFTDVQPLKGNNFYRLKIVDEDDRQSFSPVIKLFNNLPEFSVKPNPFKDYLDLQIEPGMYLVEIFDQAGKSVLNKSVRAENAFQGVKLNTSALQKGVYFIKIIDGRGTLIGTQKIEK